MIVREGEDPAAKGDTPGVEGAKVPSHHSRAYALLRTTLRLTIKLARCGAIGEVDFSGDPGIRARRYRGLARRCEKGRCGLAAGAETASPAEKNGGSASRSDHQKREKEVGEERRKDEVTLSESR
ncbi:hypothetical protein KM043_000901 [Ampulex compressa]|nr:hypothetical protein KM043_000901 [Ampulex compressa]